MKSVLENCFLVAFYFKFTAPISKMWIEWLWTLHEPSIHIHNIYMWRYEQLLTENPVKKILKKLNLWVFFFTFKN